MSGRDLLIRNAEVGGRADLDIRIAEGLITEVGRGLTGPGEELDAEGGAVICGLIDHHTHLLATAAQADSLRLDDTQSANAFAETLQSFARNRPGQGWLRATGYHERMAGLLSRRELDAMVPDRPLRIQHQTGSLWILNSRALALVADGETPDAVERDEGGAPTGRIWRGDAWLSERIGRTPPPLAPIGAQLAAFGVTGLMDASASTDAEAAAVLAQARRAGDLPQRLGLMSRQPLTVPEDGAFFVGPLKILLDEYDLPPLDELLEAVASARAQARRVAVHCVTAGELVLTLAAFEAAGALPGDRIEHGGMIPADAVPAIVQLGLTVVTQPGFVFERGDRYLDEIDPAEHGDLYRCASLLAAGAPVASSSDAPYSALDPWAAMRAAVHRRTRTGLPIGLDERVSPSRALELYAGSFAAPGGAPRRVAPGQTADLCLLGAPLKEALQTLSNELVAATIIDGRIVYRA